ncbi:hypothetical protein H6S82_02295 [Planktothrix sp. FACHB-1355]|uniref:Uncharacterized protein n=1 Tax=Aerosakkonema funiforme FACHB-1375 TaxID=2949571 RepID=A0A926VEC1_9CYAN|nr:MULTISPECIES: hypothetical protein [Oscillatoriales]MBD2181422.1 hypothetical protein [Aerosakkonema funiforme FACHB-1375]MBD3557687.1 hypothetical protein [Planktothrix sp. FACHB-1355]
MKTTNHSRFTSGNLNSLSFNKIVGSVEPQRNPTNPSLALSFVKANQPTLLLYNLICLVGKLLTFTAFSATLALLPWQVSSLAQNRTSCNFYGCYPVGGGCNQFGCWRTPTGSCNPYGCTEYGTCTPYGCPSSPTTGYPPNSTGFCPNTYTGSVLVEFVARGDDWGNVWINGREVFQPRTFDRRKTVYLCPGAHRIIITGITKLEVWASGYLDIGRTNIVRIAFSKYGGVQVSGDPYAWLADDSNDPFDVWER